MGGENSAFKLPSLNYFTQGNKYSGSVQKIFRYKIYPSGDTMECVVWHGENAIDCITEEEIKARESFPVSEDGRLNMIEWLEQRYSEFAGEHI